MLYKGSSLVELCHEAIKGARPVRRSIAEPCREVPSATGTSPGAAPGSEPAGSEAAAGGEGPDEAWGGAERPPLPGGGRQVLAMAVPISLMREGPRSPRSDDGGEAADEHGGGEVAAVLVVWERRPDPVAVATGRPALSYNAADEQILRTLAALAGHLLLQDEETAPTLTPTPTPTLPHNPAAAGRGDDSNPNPNPTPTP